MAIVLPNWFVEGIWENVELWAREVTDVCMCRAWWSFAVSIWKNSLLEANGKGQAGPG